MDESIFKLNHQFVQSIWERVRETFRQKPRSDSDERAYLPTHQHLADLVDISFWAGLQKDEGRSITFSLAYEPLRDNNFNSFVFEKPIAFESGNIAKLAPALKNLDCYIVVHTNHEDELEIKGFTTLRPEFFSIHIPQSGQLLASFGDQHSSPLPSDRTSVWITSKRYAFIKKDLYLPQAFYSKLSKSSSSENRHLKFYYQIEKLNMLIRSAKAMHSHAHGGTILVVPDRKNWIEESINDLKYLAQTPFEPVPIIFKSREQAYDETKGDFFKIIDPDFSRKIEGFKESLNHWLNLIGQLTAVDGAIVLDRELRVLAFGAKIRPKIAGRIPPIVNVLEPIEGSLPFDIELSELGNTRHQSAAQFVFDQKDALAFVASQDGKVSALCWDKEIRKISVVRHLELTF